jgi:hypothetical protein
MGVQMAVRAVFAVLLTGIAVEARVRSVLGGAAWMAGWDDETMLGRGVMWSGGSRSRSVPGSEPR